MKRRAHRRNPEGKLRHLTADLLAMTVMVAGLSSNLYGLYLPDWYALKTSGNLHTNDEDTALRLAAMRSGYVPATGFGLALATAISLSQRSLLPLLVGMGVSWAMISSYEAAVPAEHRLNPLGAVLAGLQTGQPWPITRAS